MTAHASGPEPFLFWPMVRLLAALERRQLSSRELLGSLVSQIERHNGWVNAVVTVALERAEQEARRVDDRRAARRPVGQLGGLPMTVKDAIETVGLVSTGGSPLLRDHAPAQDAPAVARLRRAGAIVFGKTNLPEFSADSQSYNDVFGTTVNPYDPARTAGGSSGGAAAALASGMTPLEIGTDSMGSIRIPASFCGVFGLKPTHGLVPQRGYLADASGGIRHELPVNVFGPLARSAWDLDLALSVLAGPRAAGLVPPPSLSKPLRLAICFGDDRAPVDQEVEGALRTVAGAGVALDEVAFPVSLAESVGLLFAISPPRSGTGSTGRSRLGSRLDGSATRRRAELGRRWEEFFGRYDALLCPVAPTAAFPHDHRRDRSLRATVVNGRRRPYLDGIVWTGAIGVVGLPAVAAPVGTTSTGLPVGVQVVANHGADRVAIAVADLVEERLGGFRPPPSARSGPPHAERSPAGWHHARHRASDP